MTTGASQHVIITDMMGREIYSGFLGSKATGAVTVQARNTNLIVKLIQNHVITTKKVFVH